MKMKNSMDFHIGKDNERAAGYITISKSLLPSDNFWAE
jgi:hypothetical protein